MVAVEPKSEPNDEQRIAQQDERDSMSVIFPDEFVLRSSSDLVSYSVKIRPRVDQISDPDLWPNDRDLALGITYPPTYPDAAPMFDIESGHRSSLHTIQEQALLRDVSNAARSEAGMPCAFSCVQAARDFFLGGGLAQAGISLLSDDCLAEILSFVATSKDAVEGISRALPLFAGVNKADVVWKEVCRQRWREKWGFKRRWESAMDGYVQEMQLRIPEHKLKTTPKHYWFDRYHWEEADCSRCEISADELCSISFDCRRWFSEQPLQWGSVVVMEILATGLRDSLAQDIQFNMDGGTHSEIPWFCTLWWSITNGEVRLKIRTRTIDTLFQSLRMRRLPSWGWQLWGDDFVFRSTDENGMDVWEDYLSHIVIQEKPEWVPAVSIYLLSIE
ncbi:hypothetical protein ACHAWF_006358 [Thalassiosira exigua]